MYTFQVGGGFVHLWAFLGGGIRTPFPFEGGGFVHLWGVDLYTYRGVDLYTYKRGKPVTMRVPGPRKVKSFKDLLTKRVVECSKFLWISSDSAPPGMPQTGLYAVFSVRPHSTPCNPNKSILGRSSGLGDAVGATWQAWYKSRLPCGHKEDSKARIDGHRPDAQSFAGLRGALRAGLPPRPLPAHPGYAGASATCAPWYARRNPARSRDAAACSSGTGLLWVKAQPGKGGFMSTFKKAPKNICIMRKFIIMICKYGSYSVQFFRVINHLI